MLHNEDVDMLLFTFFDNPNVIKTINKSSYKIYMNNYFWSLCINRVNNKIIMPMKYKYCSKLFYFKINTTDKYIEYVCKHKDENIHLAYKHLYKNHSICRKDIVNYFKYYFNGYTGDIDKQEKVYRSTKIFKCFLLNSVIMKDYDDTLISIVKRKCHEYVKDLDKNNAKELKLLNIIEQLKVTYNFD